MYALCRDGCHHCGTRRIGPSIADHIPPNVVAYGPGYKARLDAIKMANALKPQTRSALRKALQLVGEPARRRIVLAFKME